ncbi:MAG: heat-inducible transcriptional repressor HrcA [Oscillospiraceae bacterium]
MSANNERDDIVTPEERKLLVLSLVVEQFIETGEPAGSRLLSELMKNSFSSATLRNDMSALDKVGFLEQPHASAGRVPTHRGIRLYLDRLMRVAPLSELEKAEIDALFNVRNADPDKILEDAAQSLSDITGLATVTTTIIPKTVTVKSIQIVLVGKQTVVILLAVSSGVVKNKVCRLDFEVSPQIIDFFTKFSNSRLDGVSLDVITSSYINALSVSMGQYSGVFLPVMSAIYELVREINDGQYFYKGTTNLLKYPELEETAYEIFSLIENGEEFIKMVSERTTPTEILIGKETLNVPLAQSAVLISRYHIGDSAVGGIGVIGPTRMNYKQLIPKVDYFATMLGKLLSDTYTEQ